MVFGRRLTRLTGDWSQTFSATENSHSPLHEYNKLVGPIIIFDRSATPIKYFHLFYSDNVLPKSLILPNNVNARNKFNRAEGQGQGGDSIILADVTFLWDCCHRSRVEDLLLPLIIDGAMYAASNLPAAKIA